MKKYIQNAQDWLQITYTKLPVWKEKANARCEEYFKLPFNHCALSCLVGGLIGIIIALLIKLWTKS